MYRVSELLRPEHGTLYRYISVCQPSADNSSSLGSKLISSNAPTYDFYLRELLRSELTYLLTYPTFTVHCGSPLRAVRNYFSHIKTLGEKNIAKPIGRSGRYGMVY